MYNLFKVDYLIKKIRTKLILSKTEFTELLGTIFGTANRRESGKHENTIKMKRKIVELCQKHNISIEENE